MDIISQSLSPTGLSCISLYTTFLCPNEINVELTLILPPDNQRPCEWPSFNQIECHRTDISVYICGPCLFGITYTKLAASMLGLQLRITAKLRRQFLLHRLFSLDILVCCVLQRHTTPSQMEPAGDVHHSVNFGGSNVSLTRINGVYANPC